MFLEIFIILSTIFFIGVWFYKQRRESIEILQIEFSNSAASLNELIQEQQPIVIRSAPFPQSLTQAKLSQIPRLDSFPLGSHTLKEYRESPGILPSDGTPILSPEASLTLTKELALDTWVNHSLREFVGEFTGFLNTIRTSIVLGGHGMKRPPALYTCIMPTEGVYTVSLVNKRSETFLPTAWVFKYPQSLTVNDTPLVGEIQFIDVVVRPGTVIAIPCHCIYSLQPKERSAFNAATIIEIHSPISALSAIISKGS